MPQLRWIYIKPGVNGHWPKGAWFYNDENNKGYGEAVPSLAPVHQGEFIGQVYRRDYYPIYFPTLEAAKAFVEEGVAKQLAKEKECT